MSREHELYLWLVSLQWRNQIVSEQAKCQHHQAGIEMESTGQAEEREDKEQQPTVNREGMIEAVNNIVCFLQVQKVSIWKGLRNKLNKTTSQNWKATVGTCT